MECVLLPVLPMLPVLPALPALFLAPVISSSCQARINDEQRIPVVIPAAAPPVSLGRASLRVADVSVSREHLTAQLVPVARQLEPAAGGASSVANDRSSGARGQHAGEEAFELKVTPSGMNPLQVWYRNCAAGCATGGPRPDTEHAARGSANNESIGSTYDRNMSTSGSLAACNWHSISKGVTAGLRNGDHLRLYGNSHEYEVIIRRAGDGSAAPSSGARVDPPVSGVPVPALASATALAAAVPIEPSLKPPRRQQQLLPQRSALPGPATSSRYFPASFGGNPASGSSVGTLAPPADSARASQQLPRTPTIFGRFQQCITAARSAQKPLGTAASVNQEFRADAAPASRPGATASVQRAPPAAAAPAIGRGTAASASVQQAPSATAAPALGNATFGGARCSPGRPSSDAASEQPASPLLGVTVIEDTDEARTATGISTAAACPYHQPAHHNSSAASPAAPNRLHDAMDAARRMRAQLYANAALHRASGLSNGAAIAGGDTGADTQSTALAPASTRASTASVRPPVIDHQAVGGGRPLVSPYFARTASHAGTAHAPAAFPPTIPVDTGGPSAASIIEAATAAAPAVAGSNAIVGSNGRAAPSVLPAGHGIASVAKDAAPGLDVREQQPSPTASLPGSAAAVANANTTASCAAAAKPNPWCQRAEDDDPICPVCRDPIDEEVGELPCKHKFCFSCIAAWAQITNHCCLCKTAFAAICKLQRLAHASARPGDKTLRGAPLRLAASIPVAARRQRVYVDSNADAELAARLAAEEEGNDIGAGEEGGGYAAVYSVECSSDSDSDDEALAHEWDCQRCGSAADDGLLLLCDGCDAAYHIYCLRPPLDRVPEGLWLCPGCSEIWDALYNGTPKGEFVRIRQQEMAARRAVAGAATSAPRAAAGGANVNGGSGTSRELPSASTAFVGRATGTRRRRDTERPGSRNADGISRRAQRRRHSFGEGSDSERHGYYNNDLGSFPCHSPRHESVYCHYSGASDEDGGDDDGGPGCFDEPARTAFLRPVRANLPPPPRLLADWEYRSDRWRATTLHADEPMVSHAAGARPPGSAGAPSAARRGLQPDTHTGLMFEDESRISVPRHGIGPGKGDKSSEKILPRDFRARLTAHSGRGMTIEQARAAMHAAQWPRTADSRAAAVPPPVSALSKLYPKVAAQAAAGAPVAPAPRKKLVKLADARTASRDLEGGSSAQEVADGAVAVGISTHGSRGGDVGWTSGLVARRAAVGASAGAALSARQNGAITRAPSQSSGGSSSCRSDSVGGSSANAGDKPCAAAASTPSQAWMGRGSASSRGGSVLGRSSSAGSANEKGRSATRAASQSDSEVELVVF